MVRNGCNPTAKGAPQCYYPSLSCCFSSAGSRPSFLPVWASTVVVIATTVAVFGAIAYYTTTSKNPA